MKKMILTKWRNGLKTIGGNSTETKNKALHLGSTRRVVYHRLRSSSEKKMNKLKINQQCHLVMKKSHHNMMGCTPDKPYEGTLPFCLAQVILHPVWGTAHQER